MSYKPTDTFIPSNANGYFRDDSSGAAKSYKFSITKPTTYPGEETTNGVIWLLDLEAHSNNNLNSAQELAGRDFKSDPTGKTFYTTKGNYYIFTSIFSFPEKNPKNGSELHDPFNDVQVRDGVKLIRLDLGSSLSRVGYGELKPSYTVDNIIDLALDYIKNTYIDIVYGRKTSTKWLEALKINEDSSGLVASTEELKILYNDIGKLGENKVSFFIDNNEPENIPENIKETDTNKSEDLKNIIFNVQKEGIFSNTQFGELRLIGEQGVETNTGFDFGDEDDLSDLLLEDEFREEYFAGIDENGVVFLAETGQKPDGSDTPDDDDGGDLNNPIVKPKEGEYTISSGALKQLIKHEGSRATIYDDKTGKSISSYNQVKGFATIGVGHLINSNADREEFKKYLSPGKMTENQIENLLLKDLERIMAKLNQSIKVKITQGQFDALLSMSFNTGAGNSFYKKALKLTNEGRNNEAARTIESGPKTSKGKELAGLVRRRKHEAEVYLS